MPLDVIVLAAGLGKRMRSALPKVLHPLGGRPLLAYVLETARIGEDASGSDQACHAAPSNQTKLCRAVRAPNAR